MDEFKINEYKKIWIKTATFTNLFFTLILFCFFLPESYGVSLSKMPLKGGIFCNHNHYCRVMIYWLDHLSTVWVIMTPLLAMSAIFMHRTIHWRDKTVYWVHLFTFALWIVSLVFLRNILWRA